MPQLEFLGRLPWATDYEAACIGQELMAIMAWPNDYEKSRRYLAKATFHREITIDRADFGAHISKPAADLTSEILGKFVDQQLDSFGGKAAVLEGESVATLDDEMRRAEQTWRRVGRRLLVTRAIAAHYANEAPGGASLAKADDLLGLMAEQTRPTLERAWKSHKSVAPLCAALMLLTQTADGKEAPPPGFYFVEGIDLLLHVAADYEAWVTSFMGHGAKEPLLPHSSIWTIPPVALRIANDAGPAVPTLPSDWVEALRSYEARYRGPSATALTPGEGS